MWGETVLVASKRPWSLSPTALFRYAAALFCALVATSAARAQGATQEIAIASEGARPPYNYFDANNELAGFEIDLGRMLCARMKVVCRFVAQDWDNLAPGLLNRQYDAIMAAVEITEEAKQKMAFSKPYVRMPSAFIGAEQNEITDVSPETLKGRRIGVEAGGAHQTFLEDIYPQSQIKPYATLEEAILDLGEGRLDLVIGDKDALSDFLRSRREGRCCRLVADIPHVPAYFGEGIAIGLRKDDPELKAMFDKAIDAAMADGSFVRLQGKYFDFRIN